MNEIQWFDSQLGRMLDRLERDGQLSNTLVIVTSDNGMSFPRAKANLYEYGIHMPLAIAWPDQIDGGQDTDELVSLIDVTRSIFAAAGVVPEQADQLSGRNLLSRFTRNADKVSPERQAVFSGRERHSSSRYHTLGYPCRCVRTKTHLYIRNFAPERFPAGTPRKYSKPEFDDDGNPINSDLGPADGGYHDIDSCPTLDWMIANKAQPDVADLLELSVGLRPAEELFDIVNDPACIHNLAEDPSSKPIRDQMAATLESHLRATGDVRVTDPKNSDVWETYPRVSGLRWFPKPQWAIDHPEKIPNQDWLEKRRP